MSSPYVVPERSPDSFTVRAERRPLHHGTSGDSKLERPWTALSTVAGLTLLEAAQVAHGVQQAVAWCRWAVGRLAAASGQALRALVGALVLRWGWQLRAVQHGRWSARCIAGTSTITSDGLGDFIRMAWQFRLTLQSVAQALKASEDAFYRTDAKLKRAEEANMENGRRALELEARLGRLGAQLEATDADLQEARHLLADAMRYRCTDKEPCGDCAECVRAVLIDGEAWRRLFLRALALAAKEHALALHWKKTEDGWRRAYWERDAEFYSWAVREERTWRRRIRAERREATELRRACRYALEALSDPETAWTPAGTDVRQELRRVLGEPRAPECLWCGVDWCRPETCPRAGQAVLRGMKL